MVMEESELYDAFSKEDRKELLFHIFMRLVLGGAMNQYEESALGGNLGWPVRGVWGTIHPTFHPIH